MPDNTYAMARLRQQRLKSANYRAGLGASTRENAGAFAFSIMITSAFGAVSTLEGHARVWEMFLFAVGGVGGFVAVAVVGRLLGDAETEVGRTRVVVVASFLGFTSVLGGVGAAALVAWLAGGWVGWLLGSLAASSAFIVLNGLEYALAELEDER